MFTDTHCHIYREYYESIPEVIRRASEVGVNRFIVVGASMRDNVEVLELVKEYSSMYGVIGLHPEEADRYTKEDLLFLEQHLCDDKVIGIGEIGLDYHYTKENKERQKELFRCQLELALKYHLPVVVHSRDATEDTICILKEFFDVRGIIHSFSGSLETANIYIKMGYKLGINGVVTFKNSHLKEILPEIVSHIVLETDSPYLTPHPYRGTTNEPKYIDLIADFICEELHISKSQLEKITNRNISTIFDIL